MTWQRCAWKCCNGRRAGRGASQVAFGNEAYRGPATRAVGIDARRRDALIPLGASSEALFLPVFLFGWNECRFSVPADIRKPSGAGWVNAGRWPRASRHAAALTRASTRATPEERPRAWAPESPTFRSGVRIALARRFLFGRNISVFSSSHPRNDTAHRPDQGKDISAFRVQYACEHVRFVQQGAQKLLPYERNFPQ